MPFDQSSLAFLPANLGVPELLIILAALLLLFGAKRLPEISRSIGRSLTEFKRGKEEIQRELDNERKQAENSDDSSSQDETPKTS